MGFRSDGPSPIRSLHIDFVRVTISIFVLYCIVLLYNARCDAIERIIGVIQLYNGLKLCLRPSYIVNEPRRANSRIPNECHRIAPNMSSVQINSFL